jgi:hypothetical protein
MARNANTFGFLEQEPGKDVDIPLPNRERLYAKPDAYDSREYNQAQGLYYRLDNGDVVGPLIGWGYPVVVQGDWTDATDVWADISLATGMVEPVDPLASLDVYLWEGPGDPDDYGTVSAGGAGPLDCPFSTAPVTGDTVYIIGTYFFCNLPV